MILDIKRYIAESFLYSIQEKEPVIFREPAIKSPIIS